MSEQASNHTLYDVVMDEAERLTLWPTDRNMPLGWREATTQEAKTYIQEIPVTSRHLLRAYSE